MTRLSIAEARRLGIDVSGIADGSKYHNQKIEIDGHLFDSTKEANRYRELQLLQRAGVVIKIELQPEFVLQEGYRRGGKWIRPITYIADFRVTYSDGRVEVEDVKGFKTKQYQLKKKLLLARYPDLLFREG